MRQNYYLYQRDKANGVWWVKDSATGKRESLGTTDKKEAQKLADAKYQGKQDVQFNLRMAETFLEKLDTKAPTRTWRDVLNTMLSGMPDGASKTRWERFENSKAFKPIINLVVVQTQADQFLHVLNSNGVSLNKFLRILHNYALKAGYLVKRVLPVTLWPDVRYKAKRSITLDEHKRILAAEKNPELNAYYQLCWHLGWGQSDVATALASDIDWKTKTICKDRMKTGVTGGQIIGDELETLLRSLPASGYLFPRLAKYKDKHRASEFNRRCKRVGIKGISLHSYRYGLAERMADMAYPERFAMMVLGHNSKAVHRAYAKHAFKNAQMPSLEKWAKDNATIQQAA